MKNQWGLTVYWGNRRKDVWMGGAGLSGSSVTDKAAAWAEKTNGTWVYRYESYMLDESSCPTSSSD